MTDISLVQLGQAPGNTNINFQLIVRGIVREWWVFCVRSNRFRRGVAQDLPALVSLNMPNILKVYDFTLQVRSTSPPSFDSLSQCIIVSHTTPRSRVDRTTEHGVAVAQLLRSVPLQSRLVDRGLTAIDALTREIWREPTVRCCVRACRETNT